VTAAKRNLNDPETWREACRVMVGYACSRQTPISFSGAYEWLKRDWNVNTIQGKQAHQRYLADVFYAARSGMEHGKTKTK